MELTLLGKLAIMTLLGDNEGNIYAVPFTDLVNIDILAPIPWNGAVVRVPESIETGNGFPTIHTRELELKSRGVPGCAARSMCAFDPVRRVWYVEEGA